MTSADISSKDFWVEGTEGETPFTFGKREKLCYRRSFDMLFTQRQSFRSGGLWVTYLFDLPILMAGVNDQVKSLMRRVTGEGLQPRFLIDPSVVDFKKKYITGIEKTFPEYKDIIFSNPDIYPF